MVKADAGVNGEGFCGPAQKRLAYIHCPVYPGKPCWDEPAAPAWIAPTKER